MQHPPSPLCAEGEDIGDNSTTLVITHQIGRVFAGTHIEAPDKSTGIILPDGTVEVLGWEPQLDLLAHAMFKGKLYSDRGQYIIRGHGHIISEQEVRFLGEGRQPHMLTAEIYMVRTGPIPWP